MWWLIVIAGVSVDAGAAVGYDGNVFNTPSGEYTDPETQTLTTSDPVGATVLIPELDLELSIGDAFRFEVDEALDADLYFGSGNVPNASGLFNRAAVWGAADVVHRKNRIRSWTVEAGVATRARSYNYLHRGTGAIRSTRVTQTEEGDRYRYMQLGGFVNTKLSLDSRTAVSIEGGYGRRNYTEVGALESFDQDVGTVAFDVSQWLGDVRLSAGYDMDNRAYVARRAVSAAGLLVDGTSRVYRYSAFNGKASWRNGRMRVGGGYRFKQKADLYEDYWSYTEHKVSFDYDLYMGERFHVEADIDGFVRDYVHETAPDGQVRNRTGFDVDIVGEVSLTDYLVVRAGGSFNNDNDTDPYYTYNDSLVFIGASIVH